MKRQAVMLGAGVLAGMAGVRALRNRKYVAICARDSEELERGAAQLRSLSPGLLTIPADITIREEAELAVAKVRERFGSVDIVVNNAGTIAVGPMEVMTIDDYRDSLNTHFWGPYFTTMVALPDMRRRGHGRVVNIFYWWENQCSAFVALWRR
jgi:NAD(P)-dependent dehydrogenase (short-subunit alcohol dehydrogenase family)